MALPGSMRLQLPKRLRAIGHLVTREIHFRRWSEGVRFRPAATTRLPLATGLGRSAHLWCTWGNPT